MNAYLGANGDVNDNAANATTMLSNITACATAFPTNAKSGSNISANRGNYWGWGAESQSLFTTVVPPSSTQYRFNQCRYGCGGCGTGSSDHSDITNATSNHAGGANFLFADGSVKFLKSSIAMKTYWALGTKDVGETIDSSSY